MSSEVWRVPAEARLISRRWDDEFVLFNSQSGDTHLLDPVAWEGLSCLQADEMTCSQLASRLAAQLEITLDNQLYHYAERLLAEFDRLGLVEVVHP